MAEFSVVRNISSEELAEFRRRNGPRVATPGHKSRYLGERHGVDRVDGNDVYVSAPARPGVRREAREVRDAVTDRRLAAAKRMAERDKDAFLHLASHLRAQNPDLVGSMTDEEVIKTLYQRASEEAAVVAMRNVGRAKVVIPGG